MEQFPVVANFLCRKGGNCDVDVSVRCACRACRLTRCKAAGMRESDVQPKRDPTGSQKNRRAPQRRRGSAAASLLLVPKRETLPIFDNNNTDGGSPNTPLPSLSCFEKILTNGTLYHPISTICPSNGTEENGYQTIHSPSTSSFPPSAESGIFDENGAAVQFVKSIKKEVVEEDDESDDEEEDREEEEEEEDWEGGGNGRMTNTRRISDLSASTTSNSILNRSDDEIRQRRRKRTIKTITNNNYQQLNIQQNLNQNLILLKPSISTIGINEKELEIREQQTEFERLVNDYSEHLRCMNRLLTPIEHFLTEQNSSWRTIEPTDVEQLSKVELGGLMYWIEKLTPFRQLDIKDREILFKRYSVRKLSLDHFYTASKYPELIEKGYFAMINNTYVPPDKTGFETLTDDKRTREAKFETIEPTDVEQLSKVELGGLMYWIEKLTPFRQLDIKDREILFKRYSVRKLSLDHFYTASKYPELIEKGYFAMINNTYVPPDKTGFETLTDDKRTREAKFDILRPTIDRLWHTLVLPFSNLRINDAEIVALHLLLMWSPSNNRHITLKTRQLMSSRRDWAIQRLFNYYQNIGIEEPEVRLGEILLLLPELEVAQFFEFCNMSEYWYENYCYTTLNIAAAI
uniref:NR LBD domain-containing protein n=1 Tax=Meloidogyne floridensis TaxID=298350 RepID=A0A915P2F6_9BILA